MLNIYLKRDLEFRAASKKRPKAQVQDFGLTGSLLPFGHSWNALQATLSLGECEFLDVSSSGPLQTSICLNIQEMYMADFTKDPSHTSSEVEKERNYTISVYIHSYSAETKRRWKRRK